MPSRSGTTVGDKRCLAGQFARRPTNMQFVYRPTHTQVLDYEIVCSVLELKMNVQNSVDEVTSMSNVSRFDHETITAGTND